MGVTFKDVRRFAEVRATIVNPPEFIIGKHKMTVWHVSVIYRLQPEATAWEFIHVTMNGRWLNGIQQGRSVSRRYGRGSVDRIPDWLVLFIDANTPKKVGL